MINVSAAYKTAATARRRYPHIRVTVEWQTGVWTDESDNVIGFEVTRELFRLGAEMLPASTLDVGSLTLHNTDWRYSADYTGGDDTIRAHLSGVKGVTDKQFRVDIGFTLADTSIEYCRLFSGRLYRDNPNQDQALMVYQVRDALQDLLQRKVSTGLYTNKSHDELVALFAAAGQWTVDSDYLDPSPFRVPAAWLDDESALTDLQAVAASAGGFIFSDAYGRLCFRLSSWLADSASVFSFAAKDFQQMTPMRNPDNLATGVVVDYAPRIEGEASVVYEFNEAGKIIPPNSSVTLRARLDRPVKEVFDLVADDDYWFLTPGGRPMNHKITITKTTYAQAVDLTIANSHATLPASLVFLRLRGTPIEGGPTGERVRRLVGTEAENSRVRSERGNAYVQTSNMAGLLLEMIADRVGVVEKAVRMTQAPGLPHLELGDHVTVADPRDPSGVGHIGPILRMTSRWTQPQWGAPLRVPVFAQDFDVWTPGAPYVDTALFYVGDTALGAAEAWY